MTLRYRLTFISVAFMTLGLLILGLTLYSAERAILLNGVRDDLVRATNQIQSQYAQAKKPLERYFSGTSISLLPVPNEDFEGSPISVAVFYPNGVRLAATPAFMGEGPSLDSTELASALEKNSVMSTKPSAYGRTMQVVSPLTFDHTVVGVLVASQSLRTVDRALDTLSLVFLIAGLLTIVLMYLGISQITKRGLRPIDMIANTAEQIVRAEDLSRRIAVANPHDELGRLATITNDLLARMEGLFNTQKRLTADVSHELRTPLAAMRGNLEVLRRGAMHNPELLSESLSDLEREVVRLNRLVNDLLFLAQTEAGVQMRSEPVELDTLILEVFRELRPLAEHVKLQIGSEDQATVIGDRDRLKQAMLNLAYNAIQHTPDDGTVTLSLERVGREVALRVQDTGEGIPADVLPNIFQRFYRADKSRVRKGGGAGIGLAIVKWITDAHRGTIEVRSNVGEGSIFTLWLPLAPATDRLITSQLRESPSQPLPIVRP